MASSTAFWYFSSYTIASTPLLFKSFSISLSVNALSNGTIILPAVVTPKYVIHHSYLLFPITATLLTSEEITFSATFFMSPTYLLYVTSSTFPFLLYLKAMFSP